MTAGEIRPRHPHAERHGRRRQGGIGDRQLEPDGILSRAERRDRSSGGGRRNPSGLVLEPDGHITCDGGAHVANAEVEEKPGDAATRARRLDDEMSTAPVGLCLARAPVRAERERYRAGGDEEREDRHDQAAVDRSRVRQRAAGAPSAESGATRMADMRPRSV